MAEMRLVRHKDIDATKPDCEGTLGETYLGGLKCSVEGCSGTVKRSDLDGVDSLLKPGEFYSTALVVVTPDA